jgi:peptidoglycan/xylan/chitin deacetylase (PgdA/CDA1 family)
MAGRFHNMGHVSIIMYHYVRDLKNSRYPRIKGLNIDAFKEQLKYILKHYQVIAMQDLFEAISAKNNLPENSLLLTFDDGYKDHFDFVFPVLRGLGLQGSFFPSAGIIYEHKVLDVNKIHFILASAAGEDALIKEIYSLMDKYRAEYRLEPNEHYYSQYARENRFDTKDVIFIKRLLQKGLPETLRNIIVNALFLKYVSESEEDFSKELYMSIDQIKSMKVQGMYIGSHGWGHYWLDTLSRDQQVNEVQHSLRFLKDIGCDLFQLAMCYPFGAYNETLISVLKEHHCTLALTTEARAADLATDSPFALPRLDTTDICYV